MEINSVTYLNWQGNLRTIEKRITYNYPESNDVVVVERKQYTVNLYGIDGVVNIPNKGSVIDKMI